MKIGIIGAMQEEIELLKGYIESSAYIEMGNQKLFVGTIGKHDLTLSQCGVGKVNSAVGTTLLNHLFDPDCIINIGSAGALGSIFSVGDVVISSEVRYHDVDLTAFGYVFGQMSKMPPYFTPGEELLSIAEICSSELDHFKIKKALVVSGDSFIKDNEQISCIKKNFSNNCVIDMEACAIAQVCHLFCKPFIIVRSISDVVDANDNKKNYEDFLSMASKNSTEFVLKMLEHL